MATAYQQFKQLHQSSPLFILPNVWNAKSARLFERENYPAIATSSAAVANGLGYEDGEDMPFADYLLIIKRILAVVKIPLTVDLEMGYGSTDEEIAANVNTLAQLGVAGINIEDSRITNGGRELKDANTFAQTIASIKSKLAAARLGLFINVRCDTYILKLPNARQETASRVPLYEAAGADGIFLPFISDADDIKAAVGITQLPVNVMCMPGLPDFETLSTLGVKRVSMGPFVFNKVYDQIAALTNAIRSANQFAPLFA
jgi:2-methylisocitrate lyase-like PEP mutase family enzyme